MKRIGEAPLTAAQISARYRAAHLEERREQDRIAKERKRLADPDAYNAKNRAWTDANRDQYRALIRKAGLKWRARNKEKIAEIGRAYRQNNPGAVRANALRKLGTTPLQLAAAIYFQGERCAICRDFLRLGEKNKKSTVHPDHCHRTGRFRGVLCAGCNGAIGKLNDDPIVLSRAAVYVRTGGR